MDKIWDGPNNQLEQVAIRVTHGAEHVKVVIEELIAKCSGNIMGSRINNNLKGNAFFFELES